MENIDMSKVICKPVSVIDNITKLTLVLLVGYILMDKMKN